MSKRSGDPSSVDQPSRRRRQGNPRTTPPPLYCASVKDVADHNNVNIRSKATDTADHGTIERIKKCLARAHNSSGTEAEAKAALYLASRLMNQHNITQAEVLAHENSSTQQQYAGQSVVELRRTDRDDSKGVRHQTYINDLYHAMCRFFNCKCYTTEMRNCINVTFYGIAENTTTAALAFEMVYNLVNEWAQSHKGGNPRNSYLIGISCSLLSMATKEKAREEACAREKEAADIAAREREEQAEQQARLDRLAPLDDPDLSEGHETGPAFNDDCDPMSELSSGEDCVEPDFKVEAGDYIDLTVDVEDEIQRLVKVESEVSSGPSGLWSAPLAGTAPQDETKPLVESDGAEIKTDKVAAETTQSAFSAEDQGLVNGPQWGSHMQLVKFRETATNIADDYLRNEGVKLSKRRAAQLHIRDRGAYKQGQEDGKKIDVRRRRITE